MLRGFVKLVLVLAIAGGAGALFGAGLARLSGEDKNVDPSSVPSRTATAAAPGATVRARLRVVDVVLHPASTESGLRRKRARLTARVRVENRGTQDLIPARPALFVGEERTETDPGADGPSTDLGTLAPGETKSVTLRFEVAGATTTRLTTDRRARIRVAGQSRAVSVKVGGPVDDAVAATG